MNILLFLGLLVLILLSIPTAIMLGILLLILCVGKNKSLREIERREHIE